MLQKCRPRAMYISHTVSFRSRANNSEMETKTDAVRRALFVTFPFSLTAVFEGTLDSCSQPTSIAPGQ